MTRTVSPTALLFAAGIFAGAGINMLTSVATGPADVATGPIVADSAMWLFAAAAVTWLAQVEQLVITERKERMMPSFGPDERAGLSHRVWAENATQIWLATATTAFFLVLALLMLPRVGPLSW